MHYLKGTLNLSFHFRLSVSRLTLHASSDTNWVSSLDDRKSTTRGCVFLGTIWYLENKETIVRSNTNMLKIPNS